MDIIQGSRSSFLAVVFVGICSSAAASDLPKIFMTSVKGNGNLSTWPDAQGQTGLQAADQICRTRATAASLADANRYIAFLSDSNTDAYCRLHGASGRIYVNQCGSSTLPIGAGPWFRMDDLPAVDVSQNAFVFYPLAGYSPRHILYDEFGTSLPPYPSNDNLAFSATMENGVLVNPMYTCSNWTSTSGEVSLANAYRGYGWTYTNTWTCDREMRLVCMAKGLNGSALPRRRPPTARMAFVTSTSGTGKFSTWADAGGESSRAAADAICQNRALMGGLPLPQSYKAWISTSLDDAIDRLHNDGPLYRTDGALIASSYSDFTNGVLRAPLQINEFAEPIWSANVWTGTLGNGRGSGSNCNSWTVDDLGGGSIGDSSAADVFWTDFPYGGLGCSSSQPGLYCIGDNDSLFLDSFDE